MIQRLQSIFLFLSCGSLGTAFAFPFGTSDVTTEPYLKDGVFNVHDNMGLLGMIVAAIVVCFVTIFLYKNRKLQMNICLVALFLISTTLGMIIFTLVDLSSLKLGIGASSPLLALVFTVLAYGYIKKDENLVKSMDRLR